MDSLKWIRDRFRRKKLSYPLTRLHTLHTCIVHARSLASLAEQADEPVPDISNQLSGPSPAGPPAKLLVLQVGRLGLSPSFHIQSGFISTTTTVEIKNKMSRCFILVIYAF
jgi:hypothetical protein